MSPDDEIPVGAAFLIALVVAGLSCGIGAECGRDETCERLCEADGFDGGHSVSVLAPRQCVCVTLSSEEPTP